MIYVYFFIRWSENSLRFKNLMGIGFQMGQILWGIISQCEIWHVCKNSAVYSSLLLETKFTTIPYEPRHDKTNKVTVCPAKTQIRLGIRPVWSESLLSAWRKLGSLATHWAQAKTLIRLGECPGWSESSLGAQSLCWFCHVAAHMTNITVFICSDFHYPEPFPGVLKHPKWQL